MAEVPADVWVLTESHPEFTPGADYQRVTCSEPAPDRVQGGRWVVLWVRHGLKARALAAPGEPERAAAMRVERPGRPALLVAGSVLPWRGDRRHGDRRGAEAFVRSLWAQADGWAALRAANPDAELAVLGDLNQELDAPGPVGTHRGQVELGNALTVSQLRCVTGGSDDPLRACGWRANIDHVLLSTGLRTVGPAHVWPSSCPPPSNLSDHHGIGITVADV